MTPAAYTRRFAASLVALFIAAPILLSVTFTRLSPRDYGMSEDDVESPHYYGARLLNAGRPLFVHPHPGTPVYAAAALIFRDGDGSRDGTQRFLDRARLVAAAVATASLALVAAALRGRAPAGVVALALASIIAWPFVPTYLDYFGTDSFLMAAGLPVLFVAWQSLTQFRVPSRRRLIGCGAGLGLCLAIKLSFAPVACAVFAALSMQVVRGPGGPADKGLSLWLAPGAAAVVFLLGVSPVFGRLPDMVLPWATLQAGGAPVDPWRFPGAAWHGFRMLLDANLILASMLAGAVVAFVGLFGAHLMSHERRTRSEGDTMGGLWVLMMLAALAWTFAQSSPGVDPGIALRLVAPSALVMPFLILACHRLADMRVRTWASRPVVQVVVLLLALAGVGVAVTGRLQQREAFAQDWQPRIAALTLRLDALRVPDTRVAFWHDANGTYLGDASFHFTGNHQYGADYFDADLLSAYPAYTFVRLATAVRLLDGDGVSGGRLARPIVTFGWPGRVWRRAFPHPWADASGEIVAGEAQGVRVSLLAFPERELLQVLPAARIPELLGLVRDRLGEARLWTEDIAGVSWLLISVTPRT